MVRRTVVFLLALILGAPLAARTGEKPKKPSLELRVTPRFAFSPVTVHLTAELKGGDDVEEYYCPEVEWTWDDGGKSEREGDCPPFEPGKTKIDRRFTDTHEYKVAGIYRIKVRLKRNDHTFAAARVQVTVREGLGDVQRY